MPKQTCRRCGSNTPPVIEAAEEQPGYPIFLCAGCITHLFYTFVYPLLRGQKPIEQ